jgi:hypothetical protein
VTDATTVPFLEYAIKNWRNFLLIVEWHR